MTIRHRILYGLICMGIMTICIASYILYKESSRSYLRVAFLRVGQGDSIFIETPNGSQFLIDGGPSGSVISEVSALMPFYDRSIDTVLISHPDSDHIGGLPDIIQRFRIGNIIQSEVVASSTLHAELLRRIKEYKIPVTYARRGQRFVLDAAHGIFVDILFPDRNTSLLETNTASIVVALRYKKVTIILTGDSPKGVEKFLSEVDGGNISVDILKLGHHGSHTSSDEIFLRSFKPALAIISAGKNNRYGHPHKDVVERLDRLGIPYTTTLDQRRVFESDGTSIWENVSLED